MADLSERAAKAKAAAMAITQAPELAEFGIVVVVSLSQEGKGPAFVYADRDIPGVEPDVSRFYNQIGIAAISGKLNQAAGKYLADAERTQGASWVSKTCDMLLGVFRKISKATNDRPDADIDMTEVSYETEPYAFLRRARG